MEGPCYLKSLYLCKDIISIMMVQFDYLNSSFYLILINMVGIAKLVIASDCGSEGPGFESLYSPFTI